MDAREAIEEIINNSELLSARAKRRNQGFIEDFYDVLGSERQLERQIYSDCRG
jgi:hypothetical protein